MTECNTFQGLLQAPKSRGLKVDFGGGDISGDGGLLLLGGLEQRLGVIREVADVVRKYDPRNQGCVTHDVRTMLSQRILGIACGYEDLNDHKGIALDPLFQAACGNDTRMASASTLCRIEREACRGMNLGLSRILVERFIRAHRCPPRSVTLDFDATDSPIHGNQELRHFHGYYGGHCYLPLYVTCGDHVLVAYLRPSDIDGAKHAWAVLALLARRLRQAWPGVRITFRGDSGFCRRRMLDWCERNGVGYIVGIAGNSVLQARTRELQGAVKAACEATGEAQRRYGELAYAAKTWRRERRVIHKAEHNRIGGNNRYVVTSLAGSARHLYEDVYCARGDMENRIKEQQLYLFADRTSSQSFQTNQLRTLLSAFAYALMNGMRKLALRGTQFAKAQCHTIRLKLLKVGAIIRRNTRSLHVSLSSAYPYVEAFSLAARRIARLT